MEIRLSTDLARAMPPEIAFNYDELKTQLAEQLTRYTGLVVTADAIQAAKKDRAALNKLKDAIEDKRKSVKKTCLAPYEDFEVRIKEIVGMIQKPITAIDAQIKGFEEQKRNEKYAAIEAHYTAHIGELVELLPLGRILPEKWANAGTSLDSVQKEIETVIARTKSEIKVIRAMRLPYEAEVLSVYLATLSMGAALEKKQYLEAQALALEKMKETPAEPSRTEPEHPPVSPPAPVPPPPAEETKTIKVIFYDTTAAFRQEMKALTQKHNITYGGIN